MDAIEIITLIICLVLSAVSVAQLVWTRRLIHRVRGWLSGERIDAELASFARFSRWAGIGWFVAMVMGLTLTYEEWLTGGAGSAQRQVLSAAAALWCLIELLINWKSHELVQSVSRWGSARGVDEQSLAEAAAQLPGGTATVANERVLKRRLKTLNVVTVMCFVFWASLLGVSALILLAVGLYGIGSAAGQLLLLFTVIMIPGVVALYVVRCVVESRTRRTQLLWFLAITTRKQRPLASELMAWGKVHPGNFGVRVMEVARDLGVGISLADALEAQHGLLTPSDLMSVRVAEQTGTLAETLRDCAVRQTQSLQGDSIVGSASGTALWLWGTAMVAATIVSFVMYFIIPKFKAIFLGFGTELPGATVLFIHAAEVVVDWWFLVFPVFVACAVVVLWACGEAIQRGWSETWLAWKLGVGRQAEVPRLLRRLRGAVLSGRPWPSALQPMVLKHPRSDVRIRLERVLGRVTAGLGVWPAMRDSGLLTARDVGLLEMAERANNLEWALAALAESKERTLTHRWQTLQVLSVPILTVLAGVLVLLICVAFFMPLVKLTLDLS